REEFDRLFADLAHLEDEDFKKTILQVLDTESGRTDADFIQERVARLYPQIQSHLHEPSKLAAEIPTTLPTPPYKRQIGWWVTAAAVALVFLSVGLYFYSNRFPVDKATIPTAEQILPGGNRATLTLSDGRSIDLRAEENGIVVDN